MAAALLGLSLVHHPFSRFGCWLALTAEADTGSVILHDAHHDFGHDRVLKIAFKDADGHAPTLRNHGTWVEVTGAVGSARLWVVDDNTIAVEAKGLVLNFEPLPSSRQAGDRTWQTGPQDRPAQLRLFVQRGETSGGDSIQVAGSPAIVRLSTGITEAGSGLTAVAGRQIGAAKREWERFAAKMPDVADRDREQAVAAWYNLWAAGMRKGGPWKWDAIVMSKATMTWVWSWDHCFTALALGRRDMKLAMDQWMQPFPLMNEEGCLPDMWKGPDRIEWYATKPPIHGWALSKLMDMGEIPRPRLTQAYDYLVRWTEFWFRYRDRDGDGIPSYLHLGNDSGWDNATLFDKGAEIESPELSGYLVLQMRALAKVARKLGKTLDARMWDRRADALKEALDVHSWNGERYLAKMSGTHAFDPQPTSMLPLMTLAMGEELPQVKVARLIEQLRPFLTSYGPATERPDSPKYQSEGYWRGPIWAPTTYLLCDGLRRAGHDDLAKDIARRFCRMVAERAGGNYENFDALTGKGLCAPGYTWTSAVHVLLLSEFLR